MKAVISSVLFASLATAHSGVWSIKLDGNLYPGRDARIDDDLGAKRIEWVRGEKVKGNPWSPISDVSLPAITCGRSPSPPNLKAVVRAGSNVTVQWSGMIKMHNGPVLSYLGALPSPDTKPQDVSFFKIDEKGFNKEKKLWGNEELINQGNLDTFQLPSDIKPGMYILRTELVALHSNSVTGGPQFFSHCFNINIIGEGTAVPEGVKFPGGYKQTDPGVKFNLYTPGESAWDNYIIPGPPKYAGKYATPKGPQPVLSDAERGLFPPEFEAKYQAYKAKLDKYSSATAGMVNQLVPGGHDGNSSPKLADLPKLISFYSQHNADGKEVDKEFENLKQDAIKMGIIHA